MLFYVVLSFVVVIVACVFFSWSFVDFLYRNKNMINWARKHKIIKLVHTNKPIWILNLSVWRPFCFHFIKQHAFHRCLDKIEISELRINLLNVLRETFLHCSRNTLYSNWPRNKKLIGKRNRFLIALDAMPITSDYYTTRCNWHLFFKIN